MPAGTNGEARAARYQAGLLLAIFLFLSVGMLIAGRFYYLSFESRYRQEVETRLAAIADLKVSELSQWRRERLGDAGILYRNPALASLVRRALRPARDPVARAELVGWLARIRDHRHYVGVRLFDREGSEQITIPADLSREVAQFSPSELQAFGDRLPFLTDFYLSDADGRIYLSLVVPILDGAIANRRLGTLVLRIDPEIYLYPLIRRWPSASASAETLLVRRDGDSVLFLNQLRFDPHAAMRLRLPLAEVDTPAVRAALDEEGLFEGIDYRGMPVLSCLRTVPDTPWRLVARQDTAEIFAILHEQRNVLVVLLAALVAVAGIATALLWRQQRIRFFKQKYAAEHERAWLRDVIDKSLNEIFVFNPATLRFIYVNQGACRNLGYTRDELLWMTPLDIKPEFDEARFRAMLQPLVAAEQELLVFETPHRRRDGSCYPAYIHLQRIDSGESPVFLAVVVDATELRRKESDLEQRNLELERINYTMSHDLKSPLVTIRTFLGYVRNDLDKSAPGQFEQEFAYMTSAAHRMGCLLDGLLKLSIVGRVSNPPEVTSFQTVVHEAVVMTAGQAAARGVAVQVGDEDLPLLGDRLRLVELWQNLLDNAIKYIGERAAPRVEIGIEGSGRNVVFFVRDNGIGIAPRFYDKIFGWFEKLDPSSEGTGLGLPLVKRIVGTYDGKIWVESPGKGQGSCFRFTLPKAVTPSGKGE